MHHNTIVFRYVTIHNFGSIGDIKDFPLDTEGVLLVLGVNKDDPKSDSNGCFTGDTKISLLDGTERTLDSFTKGEKFWVYGCKPDGTVLPVEATALGETKKVNELVEVTLDNGASERCTLDHLWMLRDGTYREAKDLQSGDSLMPLYRKISDELDSVGMVGYELYLNNKTENYNFTHQLVGYFCLSKQIINCKTRIKTKSKKDKWLNLHHKNYNKRNNSPKNLVWLGNVEHLTLHQRLAARNSPLKSLWQEQWFREMRVELSKLQMIGQHKDPIFKKRLRNSIVGSNISQWQDPSYRSHMLAVLSKKGVLFTSERTSAKNIENWKDPIYQEKMSKQHTNTMNKLWQQPWFRELRSKQAKEQGANLPLVLCEICGGSFKKGAGIGSHKKAIHKINHKVVSTNFIHLTDPIPVYDICSPTTSNFALSSGAFVHNSGKSTLYLAIVWCLYGKIPGQKLVDDVINDVVNDGCMVELVLEIDSKVYKITRYRAHKIHGDDVVVEESGVPISRHTDFKKGGNKDLILDIVKADFGIFTSTIVIGQGMGSRYSTLDDTEKKSVIESLRASEYKLWQDSQIEGLSRLNTLDKDLKDLANKTAIEQGNLGFLTQRQGVLLSEIETLRAELTTNDFDAQLSILETLLGTLNSKRDFLNHKSLDIDSTLKQLKEQVDLLYPELRVADTTLGALNVQVFEKKKRIDSPTEKCAYCGSITLTTTPEQLAELTNSYSSILNEYNEKKHFVEDKNRKLSEIKNDIELFTQTFKNVNTELTTLTTSIVSNDAGIAKLKTRKDSLSGVIVSKEAELTTLQAQILTIQSKIQELTVSKEDKDKLRPYLWTLARETFSPKGLRAYLIARDIIELNKRLYEYSKVLFSDTIVFLKAGTDDGEVTKISLEIKSLQKDRKYSKLSQGEKRRVDIAVQFSLYDFIRDNFQVRFNILVLDEIFENLDSGGIASTMQLVRRFVKSGMSIFVITHNPSIKSLIRDTITMVKENGISRLEIGSSY